MLLTEGKTKRVEASAVARLIAKDDITAGDGKMHDVLPGKGALATKTTSNIFDLLAHLGVPVAFITQDSETSFLAYLCAMLPLEIVVRREAHGSFLKRYPERNKGDRFDVLIIELYLKTKDRAFAGYELPCDDPLLSIDEDFETVQLFRPDLPIEGAEPFLVMPFEELFKSCKYELKNSLGGIIEIAGAAFSALEVAFALVNRRLVDFKIECGLFEEGEKYKVLLADVIDSDSLRLIGDGGAYEDKQVYRDGGDLDLVLRNYTRIAEMTDLFWPLREEIIERLMKLKEVEYQVFPE